MLFSHLVSAELPEYMKPYIDYLLDLKMNSSEKEYGDKIPQVNEFIENEFIAINDEISKLSEEKNL